MSLLLDSNPAFFALQRCWFQKHFIIKNLPAMSASLPSSHRMQPASKCSFSFKLQESKRVAGWKTNIEKQAIFLWLVFSLFTLWYLRRIASLGFLKLRTGNIPSVCHNSQRGYPASTATYSLSWPPLFLRGVPLSLQSFLMVSWLLSLLLIHVGADRFLSKTISLYEAEG